MLPNRLLLGKSRQHAENRQTQRAQRFDQLISARKSCGGLLSLFPDPHAQDYLIRSRFGREYA
jgi:hypothetical protein